MSTKPASLTRDQFASALARLNPAYMYRWTSDTDYEWRGTEANPAIAQPTNTEIVAAWQAQDTSDTQSATDAQTERTAVVNAVKDLVGVGFLAMTAAQRQTLIAALAYKLGALDKDLKVRPLNDWL